MKKRKALVIVAVILLIILVLLAVYWIIYLRIAHSTFENYYNFRGCFELINKTDDYGFCKIQSGNTIKIVKYGGKWYLDGDLPCGFLCF